MTYNRKVSNTAITAADHNADYVDQVISVFATTAARDAAITSPVRGMMCYCTVPGRMFVRGASAWYEAGVADAVAQVRRYRARRVAPQAISMSTVAVTPISWDTEDDDPDGMAAVPFTALTLTEGTWMVVVSTSSTFTTAATLPTPNTLTEGPYLQVVASAPSLASITALLPGFAGASVLATSTAYAFRSTVTEVVPASAGCTITVNVGINTAQTVNPMTLAVTGGLTAVKIG